jgi:hypothetical protein
VNCGDSAKRTETQRKANRDKALSHAAAVILLVAVAATIMADSEAATPKQNL